MSITEIMHIAGLAIIPFVIGAGSGFYWGFRKGYFYGHRAGVDETHTAILEEAKQIISSVNELSKGGSNEQN